MLHVASPFPIKNPKEADEVIRPAREGAVRVLKAAGKAGREARGADVLGRRYHAALARGAARTRVRRDRLDQPRSAGCDHLCRLQDARRAGGLGIREPRRRARRSSRSSIRPSCSARRPDADLSTSHEVLRLMGTGAYPAAPKIGFPISDVRDVAQTHVLAMTHPDGSRAAVPFRQRLPAPVRDRPADQAGAARSRQEGAARRAAGLGGARLGVGR